MTKIKQAFTLLYSIAIALSFLTVNALQKVNDVVMRIRRRIAFSISSLGERRTVESLNESIQNKRFNELAMLHALHGDNKFTLEHLHRIDWGDKREQIVHEVNRILKPYTESGYSMKLLARIHQIDWEKSPQDSYPCLVTLIRRMLDHRHYEFEERVFRSRLSEPNELRALSTFIPYFFRDKELVKTISTELGFSGFEADIAHLDSQGQYWESFSTQYADYAQLADISLFYAYRLLCNKAYDSGEGGFVSNIAPKISDVQRRLSSSMPKPSKTLVETLKKFGIDDFREVRILAPDVAVLIGHLGHFGVDLMMREMGWWQGSPILLTYADKVCNRAYLSLFKNLCPVLILDENVPSGVWHELASFTPFLGAPQTFQFRDGRAMNWNDAGAMAIVEWEKQGRGFPLRDVYDKQLLEDDSVEQAFSQLLTKWGIQSTDWYVCLHMRDSNTRGDRDSHGQAIRNTTIENYIDSIRFITERGGWVIRMGGNKTAQLPTMERVIDYAHCEEQSPEMDIHLMRRARMFVGTTSGFTYVASNFGIPSAIVNAISSIGLLWPSNTRFSLKLVKTEEGRLLTQREVTSDKWRWSFASFETLKDAGLTVYENSPDEILETVKEVLALTFSSAAPQESSLIKSWRSQVATESFYGGAIPSTYFLEKYKDQFLND